MSNTGASPFRHRGLGRLTWPLVALALLLLFNAVFTEGFFNVRWQDGNLYGTPVNIVRDASLIVLVALGMTLVIATGGIDLSVGAVMAISGAISVVMIERGGYSCTTAVCAALGISLLAGMWNGLLVAVFRIQPLVATLVLMVAGRGIAQLVAGGDIVTLTDHADAHEQLQFIQIAGGFLFYMPATITIAMVVLALTLLATRKTTAGLFIESIGDNDTASKYSGVNATTIRIGVYAFSGLCAGIAGLIFASEDVSANAHKAGLYMELDAIMAVVIGGTALTGGRFNLLGSTIGVLLIQTLLETTKAQDVSTERALVPKALVVVAVCLLQSPQFRQAIGRLKTRLIPQAGRRTP